MEIGQLFPCGTEFRKISIFSATTCHQLWVLLRKAKGCFTVKYHMDTTWCRSSMSKIDKPAKCTITGIIRIVWVLKIGRAMLSYLCHLLQFGHWWDLWIFWVKVSAVWCALRSAQRTPTADVIKCGEGTLNGAIITLSIVGNQCEFPMLEKRS
jgi:hypothetical protein